MYVRRVTEIELVQHDEDGATGPAGTNDAVAPGLYPVVTTKSSWYNCDGPYNRDTADTSTICRCSYCIADFCAGHHYLIMNRKNED